MMESGVQAESVRDMAVRCVQRTSSIYVKYNTHPARMAREVPSQEYSTRERRE